MVDVETLVADLAVAYSQRDPSQVEAAMKPILACPVATATVIFFLLDVQSRTEAVVRQVAYEALSSRLAETPEPVEVGS